ARSLAATLAARDTTAGTYRFGTRHPEYERLRRALTAHRELAKKGGWALVRGLAKGGWALRPGDRDSIRVPVLRQRLAAEDELAAAVRGAAPAADTSLARRASTGQATRVAPDSGGTALIGPVAPARRLDPAVYDSALVVRVAGFQARRGLKADGVIGAGTLEALRVPIAQNIRRIQLNMERWRWVPLKKRGRYLLVNIPAFTLHVVGAGGRDELTMRVIVGNKQKSTPIFADDLKYVVLAPYWNVPTSIVVKELRPHQARNSFYLKGEDMEVLRGDKVVPESKIDWKTVHEGSLAPYRVRQLPGGANPLGPIKFILPNDNDVYLHGTPNQGLFGREKRGFSHGCVRVEDPYRLALHLLRDQPAWTDERIRKTVAAGEPKWITLKAPLPTYLLYLTAWADADGAMHYRDDIYGHDHTLGRALGLGWGASTGAYRAQTRRKSQ
ncbi:MAG: L,D-transpeptidase family protein, partial [Hymenobacteraceae bacterium]|nr:L,D-transpeptidase family protein [Hymenobacteraceae bacterium]